MTITGDITGDYQLTTVNSGTVTTIAGNATHTGGTLISAWTVVTGSLAGDVRFGDTNQAQLTFNQAGTHTFAGTITPVEGNTTWGSLAKSGSGTLTLTGDNLIPGGVTLNGGRLNIGHANAIAAPVDTIGLIGIAANQRTTSFDNTTGNSLTVNRGLSFGSYSGLTYVGSDDLTLSGGLHINNTDPSGGITVSANTLTIAGNITQQNVTNLIKRGVGTLELHNTNAYTSGTIIYGGTMRLASGANIGSGLLRFEGNGASSILELADDFARPLGGSAGEMRIGTLHNYRHGGFSARGGNIQVAFGTLGSPEALTWNGSGEGNAFNVATLHLNSVHADSTLEFLNPIDLNAANRTVSVGASTAIMSGSLSGTGGLSKIGDGALVLSGTNTYTGTTTVQAGLLQINGDHTAATGTTTVASGAAIGGTATLGGALIINGAIAPGNSIGTLTVANEVTWNGNAADPWFFELGPDNTSDLLDITGGDFIKGTGDTFLFDFLGAAEKGTFTLISWSGETGFSTGDFSWQNMASDFSGEFTIEDSSLIFTAVPEPAHFAALFGLFGLALVWTRRRRN